MGKKPEKNKVLKAEDLIEEALKAVEKREAEGKSESSDETSQESDEIESKGTGEIPVAQIDIKQYIEKEVYLRLAADFENFRKRAAKERSEAERSGREKILRGLLDIVDNLERALRQLNDGGPLSEGVRMILSQTEGLLRSEGLERIESVGQLFDPAIHDAISQLESKEIPAGVIVEEVKRGYRWSSRLLRAAAVVVSKGPSEESDVNNVDESKQGE